MLITSWDYHRADGRYYKEFNRFFWGNPGSFWRRSHLGANACSLTRNRHILDPKHTLGKRLCCDLALDGLRNLVFALRHLTMTHGYATFKEFYPYYLSEHRNGTCRFLHFMGSCCVLTLLGVAIATGNWILLLFLPLAGYGFAWTGHFFFEKNKPATFKYPLYSLIADWVMMKDIIIGRIPMFGVLKVG